MIKKGLYLSGSIEFAKDPEGWRNKMYKALHKYYKVIIPLGDPNPPFEKTEPEYKGWIREKYIMTDMVDVVTASYFFVKFDSAVFKGAGTVSEVTAASFFGKHMVYFLDKIEEVNMPSWTLGCLANAYKVNSIKEAIEYFSNIVNK